MRKVYLVTVGVLLMAVAPIAQQDNALPQRITALEAQLAALGAQLTAVSGQVTSLNAQLSALTQTKTIDVHCDSGERIQAALNGVQNHPAPVRLNVFGVCPENITVQRRDVQIWAGAAGAGITGVVAGQPVVRNALPISGSGALGLVGLTISSGPVGVLTDFGTQVLLSHCLLTNNFVGVRAGHSSIVRLEGTTVEANLNTGVVATDGAHLYMAGGAVRNNGVHGLELERAAADFEGGAQISGNAGYGVSIVNASALRLRASTITGNGFTGVFASGGSIVYLHGGATITANQMSGISLLDTSLAQKGKAPAPDIHITNNGAYGIVCSVPPAVAQIVGFGSGPTPNADISGNLAGNVHCPFSPGPFAQ